MIINTGIPRSVVGHTISGSIIGAMVSGVYEYSKYKKGEVSKSEAINATLKATLEGGIIAASGIAATNALGNPTKKPLSNALEAMSYVALGVAGVYGIQQAFKQNSQNFTTRRVNDKSTKSK